MQGTTKLQRKKYANDALAMSTLDAPPSEETMALMREHIAGKRRRQARRGVVLAVPAATIGGSWVSDVIMVDAWRKSFFEKK